MGAMRGRVFRMLSLLCWKPATNPLRKTLTASLKRLTPFYTLWPKIGGPMSHPTRQALVDAGLDLAASAGLNRLTVDAVVNKAGVAKGTFYVHFHDRTAFLVALHAQFHERLRDAILHATAQLPPGAKRLRNGTETY